MVANILILLAGLVVLGFAAHYLVHAAVRLAKMFKVSEVWVGLTVVAMGTSAPEIAVSVMAALNGDGALSVGNVIGSNIFNLGFILGLTALISGQKIAKKMLYRDSTVLLLSTLLVLFFIWNQVVTRVEGMILLGGLVAYMALLFFKKDIPDADDIEDHKGTWEDFLLLGVSLFFLIEASHYVVNSAVFIAESFGISEWAIGATIVAAGTSLPEIATSVIATIKGKHDLSVGNVVGSDIFNSLGIIGVSAVITPLTLSSQNMIAGLADNVFSMILLVATIVLIGIFMRTGWKISRVEGGILLAIAIARMGLEIYLGSGA